MDASRWNQLLEQGTAGDLFFSLVGVWYFVTYVTVIALLRSLKIPNCTLHSYVLVVFTLNAIAGRTSWEVIFASDRRLYQLPKKVNISKQLDLAHHFGCDVSVLTFLDCNRRTLSFWTQEITSYRAVSAPYSFSHSSLVRYNVTMNSYSNEEPVIWIEFDLDWRDLNCNFELWSESTEPCFDLGLWIWRWSIFLVRPFCDNWTWFLFPEFGMEL